jgi:hypothetical protein
LKREGIKLKNVSKNERKEFKEKLGILEHKGNSVLVYCRN